MTNSRLQEELRARRLEDVSARSGLTLERLQEFACGADPSLGELRRLSSALQLSLLDLAPPPIQYARASVLFREPNGPKRSPTAGLVDTISRRMAYTLELVPSAQPSSLWWREHFSGIEHTWAGAEESARVFRQVFFSGDHSSPLLSLPRIAVEQLQIMVFLVSTSQLDGASAFLNGIPFVFVARRFPARMLFTLAHEIGHLIAHHDHAEFAKIDLLPGDAQERRPRGAAEQFAHSFASCLLLPQQGLALVLRKVREFGKVPSDASVGDIEISYVARIFGVSFEVAARRCEDLKLLPRGAATSLNNELKAKYGSAEKRADALGLPARPEVIFPTIPDALIRSAIDKVRKGEMSLGRASMALGLSIPDLLVANAPTVH
jgi:Zn-dependent peptidase ImmA (M78 family)